MRGGIALPAGLSSPSGAFSGSLSGRDADSGASGLGSAEEARPATESPASAATAGATGASSDMMRGGNQMRRTEVDEIPMGRERPRLFNGGEEEERWSSGEGRERRAWREFVDATRVWMKGAALPPTTSE